MKNKSIYFIIIFLLILIVSLGILSFYYHNELENKNNEIKELKEEIETLKETYVNNNENNNEINDENNNQETSNLSGYSNITLISVEDYKNKIANKEDFIIIFTQTNCGGCIRFKPVLNELLLEKNLTIFEIDLKQISEEDFFYFIDDCSIESTPTLVFYKDGMEMDNSTRLVGNNKVEVVEERLRTTGFIK